MTTEFDQSNHVEVKTTLVGKEFQEPIKSTWINKYSGFDYNLLKLRETAFILFAARPEVEKIIFEVVGLKFEIPNQPPPEKEQTLKELYPNSF